ncbi:MAG TPA: dipeptidase [Terracidiphilus sp.]|nr:dipeptidase [Terracidiphilus sp.]
MSTPAATRVGKADLPRSRDEHDRTPARALGYARRNRARFLGELKQFVRFPTVSNQQRRAADFKACAEWLAHHLSGIGLQARILPTAHHPIVYASWLGVKRSPTILIYGHYDVQPAEPESEWTHPPFEPLVRGNRLLGRGASDDKGQLFVHIKAIESLMKADGRLPVNLKCIFEGDEEQGSPDLEAFVKRNHRALASDYGVISDTRMIAPNRPTIGYAQRGTVRFELELRGAHHELHSGNFGGAVANPLNGLCEMLASLDDAEGRIAVPGFYDDVRDWSDKEREYMAHAGPTDEDILHDAGVEEGWGEPGFSHYERVTIRPAITLNGIAGGYSGRGLKTVIPPRAIAKFSVRTVPDQHARAVVAQIRQHIERVTPAGLRAQLRILGATDPVVVDRQHPILRIAALACERGFGAKPAFVRSGGSIGGATVLKEVLDIPTVLLGFALPKDNVHAPNESFDLSNFFRGIETSIWFFTGAAHAQHSSGKRERSNDH